MPAMRKNSGRGLSVCSCCSWNCLNSCTLLRFCMMKPGCSLLMVKISAPACIFFATCWNRPSALRLVRRSLRFFLLRSTRAKMSSTLQP